MATKQMGGKTPQKKTTPEKGNARTTDKSQQSRDARDPGREKSMDKH